jgi:hypothetical protein
LAVRKSSIFDSLLVYFAHKTNLYPYLALRAFRRVPLLVASFSNARPSHLTPWTSRNRALASKDDDSPARHCAARAYVTWRSASIGFISAAFFAG